MSPKGGKARVNKSPKSGGRGVDGGRYFGESSEGHSGDRTAANEKGEGGGKEAGKPTSTVSVSVPLSVTARRQVGKGDGGGRGGGKRGGGGGSGGDMKGHDAGLVGSLQSASKDSKAVNRGVPLLPGASSSSPPPPSSSRKVEDPVEEMEWL